MASTYLSFNPWQALSHRFHVCVTLTAPPSCTRTAPLIPHLSGWRGRSGRTMPVPRPPGPSFPQKLCLLLSRHGTVSSHPCRCFCVLCFFSSAPVWPFTNTTVFLLCFCYLTFTSYSFRTCSSVTSAHSGHCLNYEAIFDLCAPGTVSLSAAPGQALGNNESKEMTALFTRIIGAFMRETAKRPGRWSWPLNTVFSSFSSVPLSPEVGSSCLPLKRNRDTQLGGRKICFIMDASNWRWDVDSCPKADIPTLTISA